MTSWPRDNEQALMAYYGEPGPAVERQLVHVVPPFQMYYSGKPIKALLFHAKAASALAAALDDIWNASGKSQAKLDRDGVSNTAGTYCKRKIAGSTRWSNHSFGAALDLDADRNGFGKGKGTIPDYVIAAFDRVGFRWGGRYKGRTDPMHFEACDDGRPHPVSLLDMPELPEGNFDPWAGEDHVMGCTLVDTGEGGQEDEAALRGGGDDGDARKASASGFFSRFRNWATGLFSGTAFAGIGALSDWKIAALLVCAVVGVALIGFLLALWLFGKQRVADWVARHVA